MHSMAMAEKAETRGRKKLSELVIRPGANGGHMVEHRFSNYRGYQEPKTHVFGPEQGEEMMAHVAKHAKVKIGEAEEKEPMEEGDEEA